MRALTEAVAALTALTIWATSDVTALVALLLSLALEEALTVERVDSAMEFSADRVWGKGRAYEYWLLGRRWRH